MKVSTVVATISLITSGGTFVRFDATGYCSQTLTRSE